MSRKRFDKDNRTRIVVPGTTQQAEFLADAAEKSGAPDRSTYILAHALKAAKGAELPDAPVVISGTVANMLRSEAKRQGITLEKVLEQALVSMR